VYRSGSWSMERLWLMDLPAIRTFKPSRSSRSAFGQKQAVARTDQDEHPSGPDRRPAQERSGQGCDYTLTLWSRLSRFLDYPELELSNNLAENAMRPVALGRRNWIHVGSKEAGPRVAAIISNRRNLSPPEPVAPRLPRFCAPGLSRFSEQSSR